MPDEVAAKVPVYTNIGQIQEKIQWVEMVIGPERIILPNGNHLQEIFIGRFF